MKVKVSVCITAYNTEKYIRQCFDSVLSQEIEYPYEILVVEDHSTDQTKAIVQEYVEKHPEIFVAIYNEENLGYNRNYIKALNKCKGKYIAVLDADDFWLDPLKLQKQITFLESNLSCTFCYSNARTIYEEEDGEADVLVLTPPDHSFELSHLLAGNRYIAPSTVMFRQHEGLKSFMKWYLNEFQHQGHSVHIYLDFAISVFYATHGKIGFINELLVCYRIHSTSLLRSSNDISHAMTQIKVMQVLRGYLGKEYKKRITLTISIHYEELAASYRKKKEYLKYLKSMVMSYVNCPIRSVVEYKDSCYRLFPFAFAIRDSLKRPNSYV